jgi:hypothetical protein
MHCSICKKLGLEENFIFVQTDDVRGYEVPICFDCAPEEEMKLKWDNPTDDTPQEQEEDPSG